jgi:hypothetical protein
VLVKITHAVDEGSTRKTLPSEFLARRRSTGLRWLLSLLLLVAVLLLVATGLR